jgi:hypothetical protein
MPGSVGTWKPSESEHIGFSRSDDTLKRVRLTPARVYRPTDGGVSTTARSRQTTTKTASPAVTSINSSYPRHHNEQFPIHTGSSRFPDVGSIGPDRTCAGGPPDPLS